MRICLFCRNLNVFIVHFLFRSGKNLRIPRKIIQILFPKSKIKGKKRTKFGNQLISKIVVLTADQINLALLYPFNSKTLAYKVKISFCNFKIVPITWPITKLTLAGSAKLDGGYFTVPDMAGYLALAFLVSVIRSRNIK